MNILREHVLIDGWDGDGADAVPVILLDNIEKIVVVYPPSEIGATPAGGIDIVYSNGMCFTVHISDSGKYNILYTYIMNNTYITDEYTCETFDEIRGYILTKLDIC